MPDTMFKTLVYSPEVRILIEGVDVSRDLARGQVTRVTGNVSTLSFTLTNTDLRYTHPGPKFHRMDRVVVWMKRIAPVLVFSGYLDSVPGLQLYPSTVTFKASCTLKRLSYTYWDPHLPASMKIFGIQRVGFGSKAATGVDATPTGTPAADDVTQPPAAPTDSPPVQGPVIPGTGPLQPTVPSTGDNTTTTPTPTDGIATAADASAQSMTGPLESVDTGLGSTIKHLLIDVGGWDPEQVKVQVFPSSFLGFIKEQVPVPENFYSEALEQFKELFEFDSGGTGAGNTGVAGGNLMDSTFTTIGPPANGRNYNDQEIVWIVTNAGWRGDDVKVGSSIIKAESGGRPDAINTANSNGTIDSGLWQINSIHDGKLPGQNRLDPAVSTELARMIYADAGGWSPWSTLVYHGTAQQHFATFEPLVAGGGTPPPGSGGAAPLAGQKTTGTGTTNPSDKPSDAAPPTLSVPYGLPTGTNITYGSPGFPDWCYKLGEQFNVKPSTYPGHQEDDRNEAGYAPNPQHLNRGIDWSGAAPDMQRFAEYLVGIAPNTPPLEQVIWQNPSTGQKIGWYGRSPDSNGSYFSAAYADHTDHVHTRQSASLDGSGSMTGAGGGAGAAGTGGTTSKLAKNIFTYLFDPGGFYDETSVSFRGRYASVNDEQLIRMVRMVCDSRMCEFQSLPDGKFSAFYPDYFGLDGTAPVFRLEDVEMIDVKIDINDNALTTHVFTQGANSMQGSMDSQLGYLRSSGVVTIEDEWLFKRVTEGSYFPPEFATAQEMIYRYGVRPLKQDYANIYREKNQHIMLLIAMKLFMAKWAEQFQTTISLTFMPELYPGMRIELVGHDLILYIKSVSHSFDYNQGFTTTVQAMAPMSISRTPRTGSNPDGTTRAADADQPAASGTN